MKTYLVPFQELETVWVKYNAIIEANSQIEAYEKVKTLVAENDSPHREVDCEFVEIIEHVSSENKFSMEDYTIDDVNTLNEHISCELELTALDIARYGKDALYRMVEEKFTKVGLYLDIQDMNLIPIKIKEHCVTYRVIPTDYKKEA